MIVFLQCRWRRVLVNNHLWPLADAHITEIPARWMAALRLEAEPYNLELSIAAFGQLRSFEQASKCSECASFVKVIASIKDRAVIQRIFTYLDDNTTSVATALLPDCWVLLPVCLFDWKHKPKSYSWSAVPNLDVIWTFSPCDWSWR